MYALLRSLLFRLPAETAHYVSMNALKAACALPPLRALLRRSFRAAPVPRTHFGLSFRNPVGLGAGFDKNARYLRELDTLGFGFVEIGTVTPKPQAGNDKPRLFRLPKDGALINRMGFNNDGVEVVADRLKRWRERTGRLRADGSRLTIGGNIGKNKTTPNEDAWKDYVTCFSALHPYVDFFVVNVSSPNTPGLRALQERDALHGILTRLQALNQHVVPRPILLKIAPDLTETQLDEVVDLALEIGLDGLVATNTTISRAGLQTPAGEIDTIGAGGLSGRPLKERSTEVLHHLVTRAGGKIPVIGSGGIFTGDDALEKLAAGAALLEVWTGFIYEGPSIAQRICKVL
ncbi:quinone-dependent dihydroorotate dehydrogenase [Flaviaesturariibacter aridisoli]|uniref:Dihydroorotate dehydrogenase (quinone) n=1 Tax=Flaviaesturariibacter aridisoli TaxID=2545761 RepID=A0A4R4E7H7_9BACT|nr:quinone-dependent dihydroorotate dehydrogenase [Flaviaesturariibacter aridisoli]TCZ73675.1 quinone-dependent dihydroorotate dehydrogenase [Flaviaesturariibacter aridisoli]